MTTFDNIFNNSEYSFIKNAKSNPERELKVKVAIEKTLQFLIKNYNKTTTFDDIANDVNKENQDVRMNFRGHGIKGGNCIATHFVLGACNEILFHLWDYKDKSFAIPPLSANIISKTGYTTDGCWDFIWRYLNRWHYNEYKEWYYDANKEDYQDVNAFIINKINDFGNKWNDVYDILFTEPGIPLQTLLKDKMNLTEQERREIHNAIQSDLVKYLKEFDIKENKKISNNVITREIDVYFLDQNTIIEIKVEKSDWYCLRYSIGQLLEYNHILDQNSNLICIGYHKITSELKTYLQKIQKNPDLGTLLYCWQDGDKFVYYDSKSGKNEDLKSYLYTKINQ